MTALKETDIDLQIAANRTAHNTNRYYNKELILRRGQSFKVLFKRARSTGETIKLSAETVSSPKTKFPFSSWASANSWSAVQELGTSNSVSFTIRSPPTAHIGRYSLNAQISSGDKTTTSKLGQFILLFNPWCAGDDVYIANDDERKEYILNDSGIIFRGNQNYIQPLAWNFGQFEDEILETSLALLDKSVDYIKDPATECMQRNNPIHVGRIISAMVNSQDDYGVLQGNWSGDYSDGKHPGSWNGSVAILRQWSRTGYTPVKYGQCWVFAGVMCTVLRCLGIPGRVVTNFASAHDADRNLTIDEYYDANGKSLNLSNDSVWNFHVWDEGWFVRKDIGALYGGWQVLDATPQELSQGLYRCGPTSVKAIKEGDVHLNYDTPFAFAELNADRVTWVCSSKTKKERVSTDISSVGKKISTKALGSNNRVDITDNYKYAEGTKKEREVFNKGYNKLFPKHEISPAAASAAGAPAKPEVSGVFKIAQSLQYSEDVNLILTLKNLSAKQAKNVNVNISAASILYTGTVNGAISEETSSVTLDPSETKEVPFTVTYEQYEPFLSEGKHHLKITAVCEPEGEAKFLVNKIITLDNPPMNIEVLGPVVVNTPGKAKATFANPLSEELTDCILHVVGATLLREALKVVVDPIQPNDTVTIPIAFSPITVGNKQLAVNFSCSKFRNVKAFVEVVVVAV